MHLIGGISGLSGCHFPLVCHAIPALYGIGLPENQVDPGTRPSAIYKGTQVQQPQVRDLGPNNLTFGLITRCANRRAPKLPLA